MSAPLPVGGVIWPTYFRTASLMGAVEWFLLFSFAVGVRTVVVAVPEATRVFSPATGKGLTA